MTVTQQWRFLNLARNSLYVLFPAKSIMSYEQIISSRFYVRLKGASSLTASRALFALVKKIVNNINANYLKIPKKHRRPRVWNA